MLAAIGHVRIEWHGTRDTASRSRRYGLPGPARRCLALPPGSDDLSSRTATVTPPLPEGRMIDPDWGAAGGMAMRREARAPLPVEHDERAAPRATLSLVHSAAVFFAGSATRITVIPFASAFCPRFSATPLRQSHSQPVED